MAYQEILNNIAHKDLRVITDFSVELGDNISSALTFITEFAEVQKEYPILFRKDLDSNSYQAVVLFGFTKDENLFLTKEKNGFQKYPGWSANYVPAVVARGPFSIVYSKQNENGREIVTPLINIDMSNPKLSRARGAAIFLDQGGNSPYLDYISNILNLIRDGVDLTKLMFDAFIKCDLIEGINIDIDLPGNDKYTISSFYTINADRLNSLTGDQLSLLSKQGFLQAAYFVVASLSNVKKLVDLKSLRGRK